MEGEQPAHDRSQKDESRFALPGGVFWAHVLAESVRPLIEKCRLEVFGEEAAPFAHDDETEAVKKVGAWIESQPSDLEALSDEERARWYRELERYPFFQMTSAPDSLPSLSWRSHTFSATTPQLLALSEWVDRIRNRTGWNDSEALDHILMGRVAAEQFVTSQGTGPERETPELLGLPWLYAMVRIRPWHLHPYHFARIQERLTRLSPLPRRTGRILSIRSILDWRLLDLMVEIGLPPKGRGKGQRVGLADYWRQLSDRWRVSYKQHTRPEALRKRWERLQRRQPSVTTLLKEVSVHGSQTARTR